MIPIRIRVDGQALEIVLHDESGVPIPDLLAGSVVTSTTPLDR
jgi:hypothetical protein